MIGQGTGGDFRKTIGVEHRLDRYIDAIASGRQRAIDVGKFTGGGKTDHYFVNILSVGMGGLVDRYVADASRTFGTVRVGHAEAFLRADDEAALTEVLHHPRAASLGQQSGDGTPIMLTIPVTAASR